MTILTFLVLLIVVFSLLKDADKQSRQEHEEARQLLKLQQSIKRGQRRN